MLTSTSIVKLLQVDRLAYRSFGPYWWAVKALLVAKGFGETLGITGAKDGTVRYEGSPKETLDQALEHHAAMFTRGTPHEVAHTTPGGSEPYHLHDEEME